MSCSPQRLLPVSFRALAFSLTFAFLSEFCFAQPVATALTVRQGLAALLRFNAVAVNNESPRDQEPDGTVEDRHILHVN